MSEPFECRVALVTGGSSGIGRATALAFAREGAKVVVASRRIKESEETVRMIEESGGRAVFIKADVSKATEVEALIMKAVETYGRLDCAFNNAGEMGLLASTADCTEENWDRTISVNLKGVWLCMKYEIPRMLKQGGGAIVNNASVAALVGFAGLPAYGAAKSGIVQLTRTAAVEYAKSGIRVNVVCPVPIRTPMAERFAGSPEVWAQIAAAEPVGRIGAPEEIAQAVVWLCSAAASFVTGHTMVVDGGFVAQGFASR